MRIVFAGTPEFAVPTLRALLEAGHEIALVITQPDRPAGRGRRLRPSAVKAFSAARGLPVFQPESINADESLALVRETRPDAAVVAAFGQKLSPELLAVPRTGCLNVHASLLPSYRGAAPINHAVINGEETSGVTILRMNERIDAGEILAREAVRIAPDWTAGDLEKVLAELGAKLLVRTLREVESGMAHPVAQDASRVSRAPMLAKADGLLPWHKSAREVHNHVRGMTPWPGAFTFVEDGRTKRTVRVTVLKGSVAAEDGRLAEPGTVLSADHRGIACACGRGSFIIEQVKPAGGRAMSADDFAHGRGLRPSARFADHG